MNEFLKDFIHSLSAREKAAFRKYASMHGEGAKKNYMRLYDRIEKNPGQSLREIRCHFEGESIDRYWSAEGNYLFQQLMNSLTDHHKTTSDYRRLSQMVLSIDILSEKGFRAKAVKILRQAKKLAYHFEEFSIILRLIEQEEEILFREGIIGFADQLKILAQERQRVVDQIQNLNELRLLREQVRSLQFVESFVNDPNLYPDIFLNPLAADEGQALSLRALENWHYIKGVSCYIIRRFDEALHRQKIYLQFFEAHEYLFKKSRKLPILSNSLYIATLNKEVDSFMEALRKLEDLEKDRSLDTVYIRYIKYARLLDLYYVKKGWEEMEQVLHETGDYLHQYHQEMGEAQVGYLVELVVRSYILLRQYETAMEWVQFWYRVPQLEVNASLRRIFTLLIYQELNFRQLLESEITSAYKELKKIGRLGALERSFIRYFRQCLRKPLQKRALLQELSDELAVISQDPQANKDFVYFDFFEWSKERLKETG